MTLRGMMLTDAAPTPIREQPPQSPPAWRVRSMLRAVAWAREARIPFSPFLAVKVLR